METKQPMETRQAVAPKQPVALPFAAEPPKVSVSLFVPRSPDNKELKAGASPAAPLPQVARPNKATDEKTKTSPLSARVGLPQVKKKDGGKAASAEPSPFRHIHKPTRLKPVPEGYNPFRNIHKPIRQKPTPDMGGVPGKVRKLR